MRIWEEIRGFPGDSEGKEFTCNSGGMGLIPGLGRSPGEGKGYPLQYHGLDNSMDRGVCSLYGMIESDTTERLSLSKSTNVCDFKHGTVFIVIKRSLENSH